MKNSSVDSGNKCFIGSPRYIYTQEYGGRNINQGNVIGPDGLLSYTLPDGWYEGKTASAFDSDLLSSNVVSGSSFFGVQGGLTAALLGACAAIDTNVANNVSCNLVSGHYVYDAVYGGRQQVCPAVGSVVTQPCWLNGVNLYLNGAMTSSCGAEGLINSSCRIGAAKYWYVSAYGGRGSACSIPGTNAQPCWTTQNGIYLYDGTCSDGYNGLTCVTPSAKYVYTSEYGGRNVLCTNNTGGSCYFDVAKNIVEPNLIAANIKQGQTIFGVAGVYGGVNTTWGSAMNRDKAESRLALSDEVNTYSGINSTLPVGYRAIPKIGKDSEGAVLEAVPQVTVVDRAGWGSTTCGLTGTLSQRISDCQLVFGADATWNGALAGNAGQGSWVLVSRSGTVTSGRGREVWRDETSGLLWSSLVSSGINWCKSVGSSNSTNPNVVSQNLNEQDPSGICDQIYNQNQSSGVDVISGCAEYMGLTTNDSYIDNLGKSNLHKGSTDSVLWRVPTIYDYMLANHNGIRFVMPDMQAENQGFEWTATVYSADRSKAFVVDGATGQRSIQLRSFLNNFRCVGR